MIANIGQYSKFIVAVAAAVLTALAPYYGSQHWFTALSAALGAVLVYVVPNAPKATLQTNPAVPTMDMHTTDPDAPVISNN